MSDRDTIRDYVESSMPKEPYVVLVPTDTWGDGFDPALMSRRRAVAQATSLLSSWYAEEYDVDCEDWLDQVSEWPYLSLDEYDEKRDGELDFDMSRRAAQYLRRRGRKELVARVFDEDDDDED